MYKRQIFNLPRAVKLHVAALAAGLMLLVAANHWLDISELVYSTRGVAFGASYTDVRAELPALYVMIAAALVAAALMPFSAVAGSVRPALAALAFWGGVAVAGGLLPRG